MNDHAGNKFYFSFCWSGLLKNNFPGRSSVLNHLILNALAFIQIIYK